MPRPCPQCPASGTLPATVPDAWVCTRCAVSRWPEAEHSFSQNSYQGDPTPGTLVFTGGSSNLLLTAANAVNYHRGTTTRLAARNTGGLVGVLAAATGASALAAGSRATIIPHRDNPDYALVDALTTRVTPDTLVVDFIGMRDRNIDVCLGLGPNPDERSEAAAAALERRLTLRGVRVSRGVPFPALAPVTVTAFTQVHLDASALQVALSAWLRNPIDGATFAAMTIEVLRDTLAAEL